MIGRCIRGCQGAGDAGVVFNAEDAEGVEVFGWGNPLLEKLRKTFFCWVGQTASAVAVRCSMTRRALDSRCGENDGGGETERILDSRCGENDGGSGWGSGFQLR